MNFILFCPFITWLEFGDADIPLWWPSQGIHLPNPSHVSPVVKQGYFLALTIDDRLRYIHSMACQSLSRISSLESGCQTRRELQAAWCRLVNYLTDEIRA